MADKVQKIREEVARIQLYTQSETLKQILDYIDMVQKEPEPKFKIGDTIRSKIWDTAVHKITSMDDKAYYLDNGGKIDLSYQQLWELVEELVSEDLEEASKEWLRPQLDKSYADYGEVKMMELTHFDGYAMLDAIEFGAKWQIIKDESTTEDLGDYINELSKQFPEVSFAKLSRIAVRVAKWQREQMEKNAFYITCCGAHMFSAIWCIDNIDTSHYKAGDRLKIIIAKED